eukprot:2733191-Heterocapsa_arctica.AAC.1
MPTRSSRMISRPNKHPRMFVRLELQERTTSGALNTRSDKHTPQGCWHGKQAKDSSGAEQAASLSMAGI